MIADTSGLLALFNRTEPEHEPVRRLVAGIEDPLVVSPYVVAELDYLVATRVGVDAELAILEELAGGAYDLAHLEATDLSRASTVIARSRDQSIGIAEAEVIRQAIAVAVSRPAPRAGFFASDAALASRADELLAGFGAR